MFRQIQKKTKITEFKKLTPNQYYWRKLTKGGYRNVACSVDDNLVIRLAVRYDRFSGRASVRLVKYHRQECQIIIVYDYNVSYKTEKELREIFFTKWSKPDKTVNTRFI